VRDNNRKRVVAMMRHAADGLERNGDEAERRARDWTPNGMPTPSGGGASGGDVSDPTGNAAMRGGMGRDYAHELEARTREAFAMASALLDLVTELMQTERPEPERTPCANPTCDALAAKAGRCQTCYAYRRRTGSDRVCGGDGRAVYERRVA
jgi:hypothetical protein